MSATAPCPHGRTGLCIDCTRPADVVPRALLDPPVRMDLTPLRVHYREPFSGGATACGQEIRVWGRAPLRTTSDIQLVTCDACRVTPAPEPAHD